ELLGHRQEGALELVHPRHRFCDLGAIGLVRQRVRQRLRRALDLCQRLRPRVLGLPTSTAFSYWMIMSFSCWRSVLISVRSCAICVIAAKSSEMKDALTERA